MNFNFYLLQLLQLLPDQLKLTLEDHQHHQPTNWAQAGYLEYGKHHNQRNCCLKSVGMASFLLFYDGDLNSCYHSLTCMSITRN